MSGNTKENGKIDSFGLTLIFSEFRLPAMKKTPGRGSRSRLTERAGSRGGLLTVLAELELAERQRRRIQHHLNKARLIAGKSLDNSDFSAVPTISMSRVKSAGFKRFIAQGRL